MNHNIQPLVTVLPRFHVRQIAVFNVSRDA